MSPGAAKYPRDTPPSPATQLASQAALGSSLLARTTVHRFSNAVYHMGLKSTIAPVHQAQSLSAPGESAALLAREKGLSCVNASGPADFCLFAYQRLRSGPGFSQPILTGRGAGQGAILRALAGPRPMSFTSAPAVARGARKNRKDIVLSAEPRG